MKLCLLLLAVPLILAGNYEPNQIHIAPGDDIGHMTIMWSTVEDPGESIVEYGTSESGTTQRVTGTSTLLRNEKCVIDVLVVRLFCYSSVDQYVHKVTIKGLAPNTMYYYQCGSGKGWSEVYNFTTIPEGNDWKTKVILFGDLGKDSETTEHLIRESETGEWKAFFHNGDIAYNLETNGGATGDTFLRQIEPIAAHYPYLVSVGNHESYDNFTNFKVRFTMPGDTDNMFYTYKIGPVLFIAISTEVFSKGGELVEINQRNWLEKTLKEANQPSNRTSRPWIIVYGHRPMYCSTTVAQRCPETQLQEGFEDLFYEYGVDVAFWGHEHDYERMFPVHEGEIKNGCPSPYINPKAPVHFISGSAGNIRGQFYFLTSAPDYVAFRSRDVGYTRLTFLNATDLYIEQVSVEKNCEVIDNVMIHKDNHGPYGEE